MTTLDSTLTLPSLRPPLPTSTAPSLTSTLPTTIDFPFDDLRRTMSQFTARFDDYMKRSRASLLAERNAHRMALSSLSEQTHTTESQIDKLAQKMSKHDEGLRGQTSEVEAMRQEVGEYTEARDKRREEVEGLRAREKDVRRLLVEARKKGKERREWLEGMREQDVRELAFWGRRWG